MTPRAPDSDWPTKLPPHPFVVLHEALTAALERELAGQDGTLGDLPALGGRRRGISRLGRLLEKNDRAARTRPAEGVVQHDDHGEHAREG